MLRRLVIMSSMFSTGAWALGNTSSLALPNTLPRDNVSVVNVTPTTEPEGKTIAPLATYRGSSNSIFSLPSAGTNHNPKLNGYVGGLVNGANSNVGDVPGNKYNGQMEIDYFDKKTSDYEIEKRFTFASQYNDQHLTQYSLQEAYVVLPASVKNSFTIGRQILDWSEADSMWGFGKLNNRRNFDYFTPGQEGLIGAKFERKSDNGMRWRAFYSPLYVPELNPALDINKGDRSITTRSPWGNAPSSHTDYNGSDVPVRYDVKNPALSDVVYRHSVGANIGYQNNHFSMDNFFIRKPENQISTKVNFTFNSIQDQVEVKVRPQFYYHDVFGSSLRWKNKDVEVYVSGIGIRPNTFPDGDRQTFKYTDIKTEKRREDYVGGGISRTNDLYGIGMNYIARLSGYDRQKEELAEDPRWNQAVNLFTYFAITNKLTVFGDIKYDMFTTDRLFMSRMAWAMTRNLQIMAGVNMIGTPSNGKSYWSQYTNNDMAYGALRYVF